EDRKRELAFSEDVLGETGIAEALVAKAVAVRVDDDAALLDRGPAEDGAVWVGNSGIALVGFHVLQAGAERLAPFDRFAIGAQRSEILGSRDFGNETFDQLAVVAEAVGSKDHRMGADLGQFAIAGIDDGTTNAAVLNEQPARGVADGNRNATVLDGSDEIVDK